MIFIVYICLRLQVSKESLSTADMYTIDFIEPLVEYSRMLKSITTAINQWTSKKKHYHKMMAELVRFIYCRVTKQWLRTYNSHTIRL